MEPHTTQHASPTYTRTLLVFPSHKRWATHKDHPGPWGRDLWAPCSRPYAGIMFHLPGAHYTGDYPLLRPAPSWKDPDQHYSSLPDLPHTSLSTGMQAVVSVTFGDGSYKTLQARRWSPWLSQTYIFDFSVQYSMGSNS